MSADIPNDSPVTLITAAGRGMGAAIARELASRGHRLALLSPSGSAVELASELAGSLGADRVFGLAGSVTEVADLDRLVDTAVERWGRIDGVVNNTGHPPKGDLLAISDDAWHSALDLLLLNVVRLSRRVTPLMERQGGGAIVNLSAFGAFEPSLDYPVSSTLRAALGAFARLYASRYAAAGIRMNNVLPGFIDSYPATPEQLRQIPMARFGKVEEIAKTVAFLLSADAGYLTGDSLRLDGGMARSV